jgi:hypothetical protein
VIVAAEVILRFIDLTPVDPSWLLFGLGEKYRNQPIGAVGERAQRGRAPSVAELRDQISDRLREGKFVINVSWKKSE